MSTRQTRHSVRRRSEERSPPKRSCGRAGVGGTKHSAYLRTERKKADSAPRDYGAAGVSTRQTRHSVRGRRCSEGLHGGLRPVAAVSGAEAAAAADGVDVAAAASRDCAGMQQLGLRCNGLRCAATDCAALQRMPLRATAGGAMQRAVHRCRLRCDATSARVCVPGSVRACVRAYRLSARTRACVRERARAFRVCARESALRA